MKTILAAALALGVMTSAAFAESAKVTPAQAGPVKLTTAQMDSVTAGGPFTVQVNALIQAALAATVVGNATVTQAAAQSNENEND